MSAALALQGPGGMAMELFHARCRSLVTVTRAPSGLLHTCESCGVIRRREVGARQVQAKRKEVTA